jgi:hypothetical protein
MFSIESILFVETNMKLYKFLRRGSSCHGGFAKWNLPNGRPGEMMPVVYPVEMCRHGYHLIDNAHLTEWMNKELYEAEGVPPSLYDGKKHVFSSARLIRPVHKYNRRTIARFAAWCAREARPPSEEYLYYLEFIEQDMDMPGDERRCNASLLQKAREEIEGLPIGRYHTRTLVDLSLVASSRQWWVHAQAAIYSAAHGAPSQLENLQVWNAKLIEMIGENNVQN